MLITFDPSGDFPAAAGRRPSSRQAPGWLRRSLSRCGRLLASLLTPWRAGPQWAFHPDEPGDAILRDLGLEGRRTGSACDLADIDPGLESTRMRLFVMTGHYWRGS